MDSITENVHISLLEGNNWDTGNIKPNAYYAPYRKRQRQSKARFKSPRRARAGDAAPSEFQRNKEKLDKADASAVLIPTTNMQEGTLRKVMRVTKAGDVWLELHRLYDGTDENKTYNLCMSFFGFRKDSTDDVATHMSKLKKYLDSTKN